jgi:hypothetical protein
MCLTIFDSITKIVKLTQSIAINQLSRFVEPTAVAVWPRQTSYRGLAE